ncbi:hypothetical protein NC653_029019 [Populus alba x Populus x berolinensis]|uniref:Uncharacterized protein n=1 Tax=Populus alba x Populus x berolinensis TaxID=444605 RepID=A0AAD6M1G6_9ROSI|nr:hypothetical protein NC653_029019 [Populus alba x Populus x berolinensis]
MMKVVRAHLEFKFSEWSPLTRLEIPWMKDQIWSGSWCIEITKPDRSPSPSNAIS